MLGNSGEIIGRFSPTSPSSLDPLPNHTHRVRLAIAATVTRPRRRDSKTREVRLVSYLCQLTG